MWQFSIPQSTTRDARASSTSATHDRSHRIRHRGAALVGFGAVYTGCALHPSRRLPVTAVAEPKSDTQQISLLTQMVRFIVVGGFSALVDFGVYNLCLHVFGLEAAAHGADLSRA